jgi:hypothetical protein
MTGYKSTQKIVRMENIYPHIKKTAKDIIDEYAAGTVDAKYLPHFVKTGEGPIVEIDMAILERLLAEDNHVYLQSDQVPRLFEQNQPLSQTAQ